MSDPILKRMYNLIYPIGSIYETTKTDNPATLFGGTWTKVYEDYDYIYTGSHVIYDYWSSSSRVTKQALIGAYGEEIFDGVFMGLKQPNGYTKKISCSAQIRTGNENYGKVYLNGRMMCEARTWSSETFRKVVSSAMYTISEIGKETTYGYSSPGVNLYVENTSAFICEIRNITVHGYFVSNDKIYRWKRTA